MKTRYYYIAIRPETHQKYVYSGEHVPVCRVPDWLVERMHDEDDRDDLANYLGNLTYGVSEAGRRQGRVDMQAEIRHTLGITEGD